MESSFTPPYLEQLWETSEPQIPSLQNGSIFSASHRVRKGFSSQKCMDGPVFVSLAVVLAYLGAGARQNREQIWA